MDHDILRGLNAAQKSAVASEAAVLQVLAPPGSGKTKTLTARVAYLIALRNLQPWNIIVCTFTVKAANEMKERIKNFVGHDTARQLKLGTFHSVALRYLKTYGQHIGLPKNFGIADSADSKAILKRLIKQLHMSIEPGQALGRISAHKVKGTPADQGKVAKNVEQQEFTRLFEEYEATLAASKLLDYDDILLRCAFLLKSHPQCVSNVQAVLIDEFQDTNNIQYDLMTLFAQSKNAISIVGDPDQSIYGFRSAEIANLARMRRQWPDTLTINLEENYRSSGAILHAAQNIIEQDENRPSKRLQATHTYGLRPVLRKLPSAAAEAEWLVSEIKRIQCLSGNMMQAGDFAVLLRSATLSRAIETALGNAGIPYRMVGGMRFYDRAEVKLVVDYLRVIHQPDNSEALERILNDPPRGIGEASVKKLREEAQSETMPLWRLVLDVAQGHRALQTKFSGQARKGLESFVNVIVSGRKKIEAWHTASQNAESSPDVSLVGLINLISQKIDLQGYLKKKYADDKSFEAHWTNVEELIAQAADMSRPEKLRELTDQSALPVLEGIEQRIDQDVLSVFLANIALTASAEKQADDEDGKVQQVTLSTIHAAKGLEWPVVFIPACYDGFIPHSRADDHDEERRLLYVGMTRAQAVLYLSCPIKNTQREETSLSKFLQHQGASNFFEEHGPSLNDKIVDGLAITLGKTCPTAKSLTKALSNLGREEDNYWPLNGEEPIEELAKWDRGRRQVNASSADFVSAGTYITTSVQQGFSTAGATMPVPATNPGFVSVSARYNELMEQASLKKVDKRAEAPTHKLKETTTTGKRKQAEDGPGSIMSFFGKKQRSLPEDGETHTSKPQITSKMVAEAPLRDISNNAVGDRDVSSTLKQKSTFASYKPRSTPMLSKPTQVSHAHEEKYFFLSSSPTRPEADENRPEEAAKKDETQNSGTSTAGGFQPASTLHATSMDRVAAPQRKTLGVKRSMNGWAQRRNK